MLNLKKVLTAKPKEHTDQQLHKLFTPWGEGLAKKAQAACADMPSSGRVACEFQPLPEHPRPQAQRDTWKSLNGFWRCAFAQLAPESAALPHALSSLNAPAEISTPILVPFSPEAALSQVNRQLQPTELLWYETTFDDPRNAKQLDFSLLLHFEAVDYACAVWLNNQLLGTHKGGYLPFSFDITEHLQPFGNTLRLCVADPSETGTQLRGKQRLSRGDIWYTAQSGIWQSVWLEWMPTQRVGAFAFETTYDRAADTWHLSVKCTTDVGVRVFDDSGLLVAAHYATETPNGKGWLGSRHTSTKIELAIPDAHAWSPEDPYLYQIELQHGQDLVRSYVGFRTVVVKPDTKGTPRVYLNDQPVFLKGVLDQGYWPDGLMTAPSDEALVYDIEQMKAAGFNMLRKHIKVESARWYYHADRLGMLVWQDMVSGGDVWNTWHVSYKPTLFKASWDHYADDTPSHKAKLLAGSPSYQGEWLRTMRNTINLLKNHPCIITWVLFNEGWGQFDAADATKKALAADSTRPIDSVSGWYDQHCGSYKSVHNYFREQTVWPDHPPKESGKRAFVVSEFGGLTLAVPKHTCLPGAYGYDTYESPEDWRKGVRSLLKQMGQLEKKGLAGYVYTQLSDVEEEMNGLLTYDRHINKLLE